MSDDFGTTTASASGNQATGDPGSEPAAPKHTPGPWFVDMSPDGALWLYRTNERGERVLIIDGRTKRDRTPSWVECLNEHDARLIAAAPDLLAALTKIAGMFTISMGQAGLNGNLLTGDIYKIARAAIAKATNSAPGSPVVGQPSNEEVVVPNPSPVRHP